MHCFAYWRTAALSLMLSRRVGRYRFWRACRAFVAALNWRRVTASWRWPLAVDSVSSLRQYRYDQAIVLPRSLKAALVPFFAAIPQRTGFTGEMRFGLLNDRRPFNPARLDQTVKRFVALGLERGEPVAGRAAPAKFGAADRGCASYLRALGIGADTADGRAAAGR